MLNDVLEQLGSYNVQIKNEELGLNKQVLDRISRFYKQSRTDLEEFERLEKSWIENMKLRRHKRSPPRAYFKKSGSLADRLNLQLSDLGVKFLSPPPKASKIVEILEEGIDRFSLDSYMPIVEGNADMRKLEDRGYGLLFEAIDNILKYLKPNKSYGADNLLHAAITPEKPFPDSNDDVAVIMTPHSYFYLGDITDKLKSGAIVVSIYKLKGDYYRFKYGQINNLAGSGIDFLQCHFITTRLNLIDKVYFFEKIPEPEVVLNSGVYNKGFTKGTEGSIVNGYSFYKYGLEEDKLVYITSRITENPRLEAVTDEQYNILKNWRIVAYPAQFVWNQEKGLWAIQERLLPIAH